MKKLRIFLSKFMPKLDPVYSEAYDLVEKTGNTSIAHLQRHLRLGYRRAIRLMKAIKMELADRGHF